MDNLRDYFDGYGDLNANIVFEDEAFTTVPMLDRIQKEWLLRDLEVIILTRGERRTGKLRSFVNWE